MIKRKQNIDYQWSKGKRDTKTINDQMETEHKDYQWSKGNRTRLFVLFPFDHWLSEFCFLLIIDSLFALFPFDHWKQNTKNINDQKETEQNDYQWSKGNRTQRISMIKRKQKKNNINDQKETEHKNYQFVFCFHLIIDSLFVLFPFDHW
jgi:hypothetical protein